MAELKMNPMVAELKGLDDEFVKLQQECEKEKQCIDRKYMSLQKPLLEKRAAALAPPEGDAGTGTPGLKGFWLTAFEKHPCVEEFVQEFDKPVLEYLRNVCFEDLDTDDRNNGFRLTFHFAENPYFSNSSLEKTYHTEKATAWTQDLKVNEITASKVDWKSGKDVTVHMVKKQTKGKKAKHQGSKKAEEVEAPRDSFFRDFFQNLKAGMELEAEDDEDDDGPEDVTEKMDLDLVVGCSLKDDVIPFAVRWYTGEAAPDDDDDDEDADDDEDNDEDDDDGEENGDDNDDDDDDDDDEKPAPKGKGKSKSKDKGKGKSKDGDKDKGKGKSKDGDKGKGKESKDDKGSKGGGDRGGDNWRSGGQGKGGGDNWRSTDQGKGGGENWRSGHQGQGGGDRDNWRSGGGGYPNNRSGGKGKGRDWDSRDW